MNRLLFPNQPAMARWFFMARYFFQDATSQAPASPILSVFHRDLGDLDFNACFYPFILSDLHEGIIRQLNKHNPSFLVIPSSPAQIDLEIISPKARKAPWVYGYKLCQVSKCRDDA